MSNSRDKTLGRVGCFLGHLRALQYAHKHKLKKVIILEDDCKFIQNETFKFPTPPKDNDIFYIGGLFRHLTTRKKSINIQNNWLKIDPKNGKILWEYEMEAAGSAPPIIYSIKGKQFVSFIATGGRYHNYKKKGSTIYTFSID